jgi:hypothetical protein
MGAIILLIGPNNYLLLRQEGSFAVKLAIHKVSFVLVAAGECKGSFAVKLAVHKVSFVLVAAGEYQSSFA